MSFNTTPESTAELASSLIRTPTEELRVALYDTEKQVATLEQQLADSKQALQLLSVIIALREETTDVS